MVPDSTKIILTINSNFELLSLVTPGEKGWVQEIPFNELEFFCITYSRGIHRDFIEPFIAHPVITVVDEV